MQGLIEFRNLPRECGLSPAEMVFGRPQRSIIPAHKSLFADNWKTTMAAKDRQATLNDAAKERYDESARSLAPIPIGATVRVQNPTSKLWDGVGVIVGIGRYRSYRVKFPSGNVLWRNRRFLRRRLIAPTDDVQNTLPPTEADSDDEGKNAEAKEPEKTREKLPAHVSKPSRRSTRVKKPRVMFDI